MSSETNKSSDTGSGKTINILRGQTGAPENQTPINNFNSASRILPHTTQDSNNHVIARDYQETDTAISDEVIKQLRALLKALKDLAEDYADTDVIEAAENAVAEAVIAQPDVKRVANLTEALKQAAENIREIAAPVAYTALSIVHVLEQNF